MEGTDTTQNQPIFQNRENGANKYYRGRGRGGYNKKVNK